MAERQDLVKTNKRLVTKIQYAGDATSFVIGLTGSAFDPIGGTTGERFVAGITNNTAAISRIIYNTSSLANAIVGTWNASSGATSTAFIVTGSGTWDLERSTLNNNVQNPSGTLTVAPLGAISGSVIIEFVHKSGSVTPANYYAT